MTQRRCSHSDAYETNHCNDEEREVTHWYCPMCDSYFPLIGNPDHWIKYISDPVAIPLGPGSGAMLTDPMEEEDL